MSDKHSQLILFAPFKDGGPALEAPRPIGSIRALGERKDVSLLHWDAVPKEQGVYFVVKDAGKKGKQT